MLNQPRSSISAMIIMWVFKFVLGSTRLLMEWSYTSVSFVQKRVFVMTRICNPVASERGMRKESLGVGVRLCLLSSGLMIVSTL